MRASTIAAVTFLAAGCAHTAPAVLDADYGRLQPDQTVAVDSARTELARAHDELAGVRSRAGEARSEEKLAEADRAAAQAETERAKRLVEAADARSRAAEARADYAEKLGDAREAAEEAAQARVEAAAAKVELLKLQALGQAKLQPSQPYDEKAFYGEVAVAQKKLDDAGQKAKTLDEDANAARRRWDDLKQKVPATAE
jgi:hypothetical protein